MLDVRWKAALFLCALGVICIFIWLISSANIALLAFSCGLLLYLARHLYWLHQLQKWFKKPQLNSIPEGSGVWEDVYTALLKYERNNQKNQTQLNLALERFNLATTAMPDGLVILNASNEIEWCTPHAETQLGLNLETDKNLPIVNLIRDSHFISFLYHNEFNESFKLKSPANLERNTELILEILLIPFANNQKLLISRDMTQLEKVEIMRRDFIANVSHELRTPLTVVGGFLETLSDMEGAVPDNLKNYFAMMEDQTIRMRRIIEDLLTLSTIESNAETPENIEINMPSLLKTIQKDAIGLSQSLYKTKHTVHLKVDEQLNLSGAQEELHSALSNLVSNAVRYTPKGGELWIHWQLKNGQPVFSVRDTGIGIEPQHIDRLTERFYRVDRSRSRETGGTGLGLSIVKHILIRHQAKLEVSSALGKGSTFSVIFPEARVVHHSTTIAA